MHEDHQNSKSVYTCPMHPEIQQANPGRCPECGMTLVQNQKSKIKNQNLGHGRHEQQPDKATEGKHAGHSTKMFLRKFWVSLILTIPVLLYSDIVRNIFILQLPSLEIKNWKLEILIPSILGSAVFFYGGWVFLAGAWREIRGKLPGMMTLIGIAITSAYLWSVYAAIAGLETLFWELTTLITIMLLGHWLEMRAVSGTMGALKELSKLLPDTAEVIRNGQTEKIPLSELRENEIVL